MRAEELVRRAGQEVGAEGGQVHGGVRARGAPRRRTTARHGRARGRAIAGRSGRVPSRFDAPVTATRRVRADSSAATSSGRSSPVSRSNPTQRTVAPTASRGLHPRPDVGVVVQPGDHHLVAGRPRARQRPGQVVGQGGHAPAEDHPARVGADEVGHRRPGLEHDLVGAARGGADVAAVGDARQQGGGDRLPDAPSAPASRPGRRSGRPLPAAPGTAPGRTRRAKLMGRLSLGRLRCAALGCGLWSRGGRPAWLARDDEPEPYEPAAGTAGGPSPLPGPGRRARP